MPGRFFLTLIMLGLAATSSHAQGPSLIVAGAIENRRITITGSDLARLPRHSVSVKTEQGMAMFEGVLLQSVLELAGLRFGKALTGARLLSFVVAEGAPPTVGQLLSVDPHAGEDYQAVFALPELDTSFTNQPVVLATSRDGRPLQAPEGPYRVISPQDKRANRWVKDVKILWVLFADNVSLR